MNKLILLVVLLGFQQTLFAKDPEHSHSTSLLLQTVYVCPMHPEVKSNKPANCPKCGMKLVAQKAKVTKPPVKKKAPAPKTAPAPKPKATKPVSPVPVKKAPATKAVPKPEEPMPDKKSVSPEKSEHHQPAEVHKDHAEMNPAKANLGAIKTRPNHTPPRWDPLESTCRHASLSIL